MLSPDALAWHPEPEFYEFFPLFFRVLKPNGFKARRAFLYSCNPRQPRSPRLKKRSLCLQPYSCSCSS
jgi:hypothetical protein